MRPGTVCPPLVSCIHPKGRAPQARHFASTSKHTNLLALTAPGVVLRIADFRVQTDILAPGEANKHLQYLDFIQDGQQFFSSASATRVRP